MCDIERISISNNINKSDVMDWMTTYQLKRSMQMTKYLHEELKKKTRKRDWRVLIILIKLEEIMKMMDASIWTQAKKQNETVPRTLVNNVQN